MKKRKDTRDFACLSLTLLPRNRSTHDSARHWIKLTLSRNRSGQVWIETVIYTLIAFVMIGLVLSYARPEDRRAPRQGNSPAIY